MFRNYFKIAWRNLWKNKFTSFINIFGLTISIAICLLISLFIHDEINYDTFEKDHKQIYRLEQDYFVNGETKHWAASPPLLSEFVQSKFPEIESSARIVYIPFTFIKINDKKFKEEDCLAADSSIFETLGLTLVAGNPKTALIEPNSIVLTEKIASIMFGRYEDAMNKTLIADSKPCKVTGILKDLPSTSHLKISLLRPINLLKELTPEMFDEMNSRYGNSVYTYVKIRKATSLKPLVDKVAKAYNELGLLRKPSYYFYNFHNISKIHLDGNIEKEISPNSSWLYIYIFLTIGVLIILLASINYINLTTSRSLQRSKEIGIRKTLGAFKKNLVTQFMSESVLITVVSFVIGLLIVFLSLPNFNALTGKDMLLSSLLSPFFLIVSLSIILFIGFLAGIYPAFVISSFDPINALKGISNINTTNKFSFGFRKSLVIFQFVVSAFLVISSVAVINQISYMFNKSLGYTKENIMILPALALNRDKLNTFRAELKNNPGVVDVSATSAIPGKRVYLKGVTIEGKEMETTRTMCVDEDYLKTMKMEIVQGRDFDRNIGSDSIEGVIFNEAAIKFFGLKKPFLGKNIQIFGDPPGPKFCKLIGVVKDFHQGSLHTAIEPMAFHVRTFYNSIVIRYNNDDATKKYINDIWTRSFPDQLFAYTMLADNIENLYRSESTLKKLLIIFTSFAIAIASLGLFGLIYFSNTLRKKEIGIRKILGAANSSIIYLLSREYIILIVVSLMISIPLSGYMINKWLNNFAYRTDISVFTFVIGIVVTLLIASATIVVQGMKAALDTPVNNIKTE